MFCKIVEQMFYKVAGVGHRSFTIQGTCLLLCCGKYSWWTHLHKYGDTDYVSVFTRERAYYYYYYYSTFHSMQIALAYSSIVMYVSFAYLATSLLYVHYCTCFSCTYLCRFNSVCHLNIVVFLSTINKHLLLLLLHVEFYV